MKVIKKPTIKKVVKRNSAVNAAKVNEYQRITDSLRAQGILKTRKYSIGAPLGGDGKMISATQ